MKTIERQKLAEEYGIAKDVGRKVKAMHHYVFRCGDTAEIVGWGLRARDNRPIYYIRFENGECDIIPAGEYFKFSGFAFID